MDDEHLRTLVVHSLEQQGFGVNGSRIVLPAELDKNGLRALHVAAVRHRVAKCERALRRHEPRLLTHFAAGTDVVPERIQPKLIEVQPETEEELLFRYATLHWSIPVSSGYGRRLRFVVIDEQNGKLIGLFGLGDPVISVGARDRWLGWDRQTKHERLHHVMDAFALGAVPPYTFLLGGKLVAMLVTSDEVRAAFQRKYGARRSVVRSRNLDSRLTLVTTTSALGRSSIYNRLTFGPRLLYQSVGFTRGSGEFHFANGLYDALHARAVQHCKPTAKQPQWGPGFRNRREVVRKALSSIGLPSELVYHGVEREIYVVPMAINTREYLRGEQDEVRWFDQPADSLFRWFRERWLLQRAERDERYRSFSPSTIALWNEQGSNDGH